MPSKQFTTPTSEFAREANSTEDLCRRYADLNLIECIRLPSGMRLFDRSDAPKVAAIRAARLANRGRRTASVAGSGDRS
jgi:DNA-binding transcriptional MerR regulator